MLRYVSMWGLALCLVGLVALPANAEERRESEKEQKVTLEQLPPAVRATLEKEAQGGTIDEIEKETEHGKTVYEAEVTIKGQRWEIEISASGKVLGREREDDDGDDDDDDDDKRPAAPKR